MRLPPGSNKVHQRWEGASRIIRVYAKWEENKLRIECAARSRFLRSNQINDLLDYPRLLTSIVPKYLMFASLDRQKVTKMFQRRGISAPRTAEINRALDARAGSLWETLRYLRKEVGLKNTRRFLIPMKALNGILAASARELAARFSTSLK